jgi:predicted ferric reductase
MEDDKKVWCMLIGIMILFILMPFIVQAHSSEDMSMGKEILDRLTRLETRVMEGQKALEVRIVRIEEGMDGLDKRMDDLRGLIYVALGGIITLICGLIAMIGFVLWDRRTAITPVVRRTGELEKEFDEEKHNVMRVFKEYAKVEPRFAEVLRTVGMM